MKIVSLKNLKAFSLVAAICLAALVLARSKQFFFETRTIPSAFNTTPNRWRKEGTSFRNGSEEAKVDYQQTNIQSKKSPRIGYILVNQFFDQMTGASYSVLSLQCWAGAVSKGLKVVEPFVYPGSSFGISLKRDRWSDRKAKKTGKDSDMVRLRDVLNLHSWEEQIRGHGYAPFESWKVFLMSAPRNLIIVSMACREQQKNSCNDHFYKVVSLFAKEHSFNIVRSVHLQVKLHSFDEFTNLIYGAYEPKQSVVLFNHWGGIMSQVEGNRIAISNINPCIRTSFFDFLFDSSLKIVEDSRRYLDRYMPKDDESNYISVMLRTEKFGLSHIFGEIKSQEEKLSLFTKCVKGIINQVHSMQESHKTAGVFLTVDCRKYGSRGLSSGSSYISKDLLDTVVETLFRELKTYGMRLSLDEWDASFDEVTSFQTPGYVALLQKNLAASGKCLVTAGGGSFQNSAQALYKSTHNKITLQCCEVVPEC